MTRGIAPDFGREAESQYRLWDEVKPGLWIGGTADDDALDTARRIWNPKAPAPMITTDEFDAVVTMYAYAQPVDWLVEELRWGIFDGPDDIDSDTLNETVEWAYRRWRLSDKRVLIRCQAGLNRSGLVTALVLMRDGMTARGAIDLIREKRDPYCLSNDTFERYLIWHEAV